MDERIEAAVEKFDAAVRWRPGDRNGEAGYRERVRRAFIEAAPVLTAPLREELATEGKLVHALETRLAERRTECDSAEKELELQCQRAESADREAVTLRTWHSEAEQRTDSAERRLEEAREALEEPIHTLASTIGRIHVALQNPRRNPSPLPDVEANVVAMGRLRAALATLQGSQVDGEGEKPQDQWARESDEHMNAVESGAAPTPEQPEEPTCGGSGRIATHENDGHGRRRKADDRLCPGCKDCSPDIKENR